jgi:hypothetical protein
MPRRIGYLLVSGAAAAGLLWAGWPGAPANLATLIRRVDVIAAVILLAGLPWLARKVLGPAGGGLKRVVRLAGYAAVGALVLLKAEVERAQYAAPSGRAWLAGAWAGEIVFLLVLAVYLAGLLAVTARRPPAGPAALALGTGAGLAAGLIMYAVPPLGMRLPVTKTWQVELYGAAQMLAVALALGVVVAAGVAAARRTSRTSRLPVADARPRQGVAAGLCAGAAAALVVSLVGLTTIALLPHELPHLQWAFSGAHLAPGSVYEFEIGATDTAAGHLLVLIVFPLLGAGLGAWGGLYGAGRPGQLPGGGGGGGRAPVPAPAPPAGGRRLDDDHRPSILAGGYLRELPAGAGLNGPPREEHAPPGHPDRAPVGHA